MVGEIAWISPIKDAACSRAKEESQQDGRRGEIKFTCRCICRHREMSGHIRTDESKAGKGYRECEGGAG